MQTLYAFKQAEKANLEISKDLIADTFLPDLNSMEFQDKEQLESFKKLGWTLLEEKVAGIPTKNTDIPAKVLLAANKAKSFYDIRRKKDIDQSTMLCIEDAEKVYDLYLLLLSLFVELATRSAQDERTSGAASLFIDNQILDALKHHKGFEEQLIRRGISWRDEQATISKLYREAIKKNDTYLAYISKKNHTFEEDFSVLKYILKNILLKNEISWSFFELKSLYWTEDIETLRAMVSHTLESFREGAIKLEYLDADWEEKRTFMVMLVKKSIDQSTELENLLLPHLKNWEFDRIAETDEVLLKMTLIEMMNSPSVPTKVSINEAIEISKVYSTPKSGQFINGLLDVLSKELVASGAIKKSGRGLIDNK